MVYGGDELAVRGRVQLPSPDWSRIAEPSQATRGAGRQSYQGSIAVETGKTARLRQTVSEADGRVSISVEVTADADLDVAGVYYSIDVPRAEFVGGQASRPYRDRHACRYATRRQRGRTAVLPRRGCLLSTRRERP